VAARRRPASRSIRVSGRSQDETSYSPIAGTAGSLAEIRPAASTDDESRGRLRIAGVILRLWNRPVSSVRRSTPARCFALPAASCRAIASATRRSSASCRRRTPLAIALTLTTSMPGDPETRRSAG